jgi:hypothetical protein
MSLNNGKLILEIFVLIFKSLWEAHGGPRSFVKKYGVLSRRFVKEEKRKSTQTFTNVFK